MMNRIEKLQEFLQTSGPDSFLQHALALEYVKLGKDDEANLLFREILVRDPGYIGSYYHLGKLLERTGREKDALDIYRTGMDAAKQTGDTHAYNELRAALEELED